MTKYSPRRAGNSYLNASSLQRISDQQAEIVQIQRMYHKEKMTLREIAKHFNRSVNWVVYRLKG